MDSHRTRRPEIVKALNTLKAELDTMPKAGNPKAVIDNLAKASRLAHPNWIVPPLGHPDGLNKRYSDGTVCVMLLAHKLFINKNGAYRIVDLHPPNEIFYECQSSTGLPFVEPVE